MRTSHQSLRISTASLTVLCLGLLSAVLNGQVFDVTSTGINGTAIGTTTPGTGAFTTLSTSGNARIGGTTDKVNVMSGSANGLTIQGSGAPSVAVWDTSNASYVGYLGQAEANTYIGSNSGDLLLGANAINIATVSATGLSISGLVSASTTGAVVAGAFRSDTATQQTVQVWNAATSGTRYLVQFYTSNPGAGVGSISTEGSSTSYNTTSDVRLKTNLRNIDDADRIVDALQPRLFDWKAGEKNTYGFVAQEVAEVFPQAVTRGDDNPEHITRQWSMDASKLVPVLTAEIKSLRSRVAALEAARAGETSAIADLSRQLAALRTEVAAQPHRAPAAPLVSQLDPPTP